MTKEVIMVEGSVTVSEAIEKMCASKVTALIVNRREYGDAYGILTRRDIVNKVIAEGRDPSEIKVADVMTKPIITVTPDLNIKYVARLMAQTFIRHLPVFDGHKMLEIISNSDIFRHFSQQIVKCRA